MRTTLFLIPLILVAGLYGEVMRFDIDYLGITWIKVDMTDANGTLTITARSTGLAEGWAYTDNRYEIDHDDASLPSEYRKHIRQKKYREESVTTYNRASFTARYENQASGKLPRTYRIDPAVRDFFSALYRLRTDLDCGELLLDAGGLTWAARIERQGVEPLSVPWGKQDCDRVKITFRKLTPGEPASSDMLTNNLVNEKNTLLFWISRDERHAPVRAEYKLFPFSVVWKLREYHP